MQSNGLGIIVMKRSKADVFEVWLLPAVLTLCEMFRVQTFHGAEIFIDGQTLLEVLFHLHAFRNPLACINSIVIIALKQSTFVGQARELVVCLIHKRSTRYSWN